MSYFTPSKEKELRESRAAVLRDMQSIVDSGNGTISGANLTRYNELRDQDDSLTASIDAGLRLRAANMVDGEVFVSGSNGVPVAPTKRAAYGKPLANGVSMRGLNEQAVDNILRDVIQNRTMNTLSGGDGGMVALNGFSNQVWDLARAGLATAQAGLTIIPFRGNDFSFPTLEGVPTPEWREEMETIGTADLAFGMKRMEPRNMAKIIKVSNELLDDSAIDLEGLISAQIARAFAAELDRVILWGTGTNSQPLGLYYNDAITKTDINAKLAWSHLVAAQKTIRASFYDPKAVILSERDYVNLTGMRNGDVGGTIGDWLSPHPYVADLELIHSPSIPETNLPAAGESAAFVGDFSQVILGVRQGVRITPLPELYAAENCTGVRFTARYDVGVVRPAALQILNGTLA